MLVCMPSQLANCTSKPEPPCWVGECPKEESETPILLPHRCRCNKYFTCKKGEPELSDCPDDKHFNPVSKACEDPKTAGCEDSESTE